MATIKRFEDLEIWQEARKLAKDIHQITVNTPLKTDFRFQQQKKPLHGL
jgi:Txe/YoeB family toxin of Txe-Axe toxin-antitoxin module